MPPAIPPYAVLDGFLKSGACKKRPVGKHLANRRYSLLILVKSHVPVFLNPLTCFAERLNK
jgi:hypothetical protein